MANTSQSAPAAQGEKEVGEEPTQARFIGVLALVLMAVTVVAALVGVWIAVQAR